MNLLDRYIGKTVFASIILVTVMLIGLHGFILLVNQLDDLGKGHYGIYQAIQVVLLSLPYQVYLFFPVASLLGCLLGLGLLANHRELIVMRAAGMSIGNVILAVFKIAMVLIIAVTWLGEFYVPQWSFNARDIKTEAISGMPALRTPTGVWLRYHRDFLMLGRVVSDHVLQHVVQFHFDASHQLRFMRSMDEIHYEKGIWHATGVQETLLDTDKTGVKQYAQMEWPIRLNPNILKVSRNEPDEMSLPALYAYLRAQKNKITYSNYQLAYWQRIMQPLTTLVMMLLAIPFIFGPLRSSTMGAKLLIGISVGFGFHLINRFFGPVSQVYQWPSWVAAVLPTVVFAVLGLLLMRRMRG